MKKNEGTVAIAVDGKIHKGRWTLSKGIIEVEYNGKSKLTQLGNWEPEEGAKHLLNELVRGV
jgi:hypothetical protein